MIRRVTSRAGGIALGAWRDALRAPAARVPRLAPAAGARIVDVPDPPSVAIPLEYPGQILFRPQVNPGDAVGRGQVIGRSELGNCLHASIPGRVQEIRTAWSARGHHVPVLVIERDGGAIAAEPPSAPEGAAGPVPGRRGDLLRAGGVVSPWTTPGLDHAEAASDEYPAARHVVILGVNQEPTIFNYELLLQERGGELQAGLRRLSDLAAQAKVWLTVPQRLASWAAGAFAGLAEVVVLPDGYRDRVERLVVARVTGLRVPPTVPYRARGAAVLSVEQALAALDALQGRPFIRKTVTIAGDGVGEPVTLRAPLGTSVRDLLAARGLCASDFARVVMGGPMQGAALYTDETYLSKFQHGVYLARAARPDAATNLACVNCGRCTRSCPARLQVHQVGRHVEYNQFEQVAHFRPELCLQCGLCAYVCPARRPLVQMVRLACKYGGTRT